MSPALPERVAGPDEIRVRVRVTRRQFGVRSVRLTAATTPPERVPFTLGPLRGHAYVSEAPELEHNYPAIHPGMPFMRDYAMTLEMELLLVPDGEVTIADLLVAFAGAEVVP